MSENIESVATDIVDCAIKVHKELGLGLLESAYQHCIAHELKKTKPKSSHRGYAPYYL